MNCRRPITCAIFLLAIGLPFIVLAADAGQTTGGALSGMGSANPLPDTTAGLFTALLKVFGALAMVIGLMALTAWLVKKLGFGGGIIRQGSLINVLETRMIAPKKYVSVLKIGNELLVVGVSDQNINCLTKLTGETAAEALVAGQKNELKTGANFSSLLDKASAMFKSNDRHTKD